MGFYSISRDQTKGQFLDPLRHPNMTGNSVDVLCENPTKEKADTTFTL